MRAAAVLALLALAACGGVGPARPTQSADDNAYCTNYGYAPSSAAFNRCLEVMQRQRELHRAYERGDR
jgi:hypothetical protein